MDNFISVIWYHLKRYGTKEFIISLHLENVNIKKNWYEYIESGPDQNLVDIIYIYIYHRYSKENNTSFLILQFEIKYQYWHNNRFKVILH